MPMNRPRELEPAVTEAQLQQQVLDLAALTGWLAYHTHDSRRSQPGFPDLVLVNTRQERTIFAELKTATGRVSEAQRRWLHTLTAAGNETALWRPGDLPEIRRILQGQRITTPGKDSE